jgi:hypothetical protein
VHAVLEKRRLRKTDFFGLDGLRPEPIIGLLLPMCFHMPFQVTRLRRTIIGTMRTLGPPYLSKTTAADRACERPLVRMNTYMIFSAQNTISII